MNATINFGPIYVNSKGNLYTLAPHGTVLVKAPGVTTWIPSAMGKDLLDINIKHGHLRKR